MKKEITVFYDMRLEFGCMTSFPQFRTDVDGQQIPVTAGYVMENLRLKWKLIGGRLFTSDHSQVMLENMELSPGKYYEFQGFQRVREVEKQKHNERLQNWLKES